MLFTPSYEHGTEKAYQLHLSYRELACQACLDSHAALVDRRRAARAAGGKGISGSSRLIDPCALCGTPARHNKGTALANVRCGECRRHTANSFLVDPCVRCGADARHRRSTALDQVQCTECRRRHGAGVRYCSRCGGPTTHGNRSTVVCRDCIEAALPDDYMSKSERAAERAKPVVCPWCGTQFQRATLLKQYCSRSCCRAAYQDKSGWCGHDYRSRVLHPELYVESVSRVRVFERDGWTCHICGGAIPEDAKVPDRRAATLDHVVPLSRGGEHSYANVRAAHYDCNMRKGNRDGSSDNG